MAAGVSAVPAGRISVPACTLSALRHTEAETHALAAILQRHFLGVFLHHHGIGPDRQGGAGEDACDRPLAQGEPGMPRRNALGNGEHPVRVRLQLRCAHGVAIHLAGIPGGDVHHRDHGFGQHPAVRLHGRNDFDTLQGLGTREQALKGLVKGEQ